MTIVSVKRLSPAEIDGYTVLGVVGRGSYGTVFKVRDGRIAEMREFMDTLSGFRQVFGEEAVSAVEPLVA